jgi:hypothetical protein
VEYRSTFLTSETDGGERAASRSGGSTPGENARTHWYVTKSSYVSLKIVKHWKSLLLIIKLNPHFFV